MNRALLIFFGFAFFALIFLLVRNCINYYEYVQISEQYPALDVHARTYHSTKEIHSALRLDNNLNPFYTWFDISPSVEPSSMKLYGYGPTDEKIDNYRLRVFILCNQHAREVVTGELCYHIIRLLQLYTRDDYFTDIIEQQTLKGIAYWIVPVGNPWGRQFVESNSSRACRRMNANDVDLNRNFPSMHANPFLSTTDEENPGPEPFSEYESQAVAAFADFVQPHLVLNIHSGANAILLPFDGDDESIPPYYSRLLSLASYARKGVCPECLVGQSSLNYPGADGTFIDYMVMSRGVPLAYTLEIYGNESHPDPKAPLECQNFFNPPEGDELAYTIRKWLNIVFRLTEKLSTLIKN